MIVRSGIVKRRSPSDLLTMLRLQLRLIGPSAVVFAALVLVVDAGGRLQLQLKSMEAADRGAIQLLLILLCPLFLSFVSVERESVHLTLSWPMRSWRIILARIIAVFSVSILILCLGWLLADLQILFNQRLWGMPGIGGVLGGILYISVCSQSICLVERSLLPRVMTFVGWTFAATGMSLLATYPHSGEVGSKLAGLTLLAVSAAPLFYAESLCIGRLRRWQVHGGAFLLLSALPGSYLLNLYGPRFSGPITIQGIEVSSAYTEMGDSVVLGSAVFPRMEFHPWLNPQTGQAEEFGFLQPLGGRLNIRLFPEGWLFGRSPDKSDGPVQNFLVNVKTNKFIELPPEDDLVQIDGRLWVFRLAGQGPGRARLLLAPFRKPQEVREIEIQGIQPDLKLWKLVVERLDEHTSVAHFFAESSLGSLVFDIRKKRQTTTYFSGSRDHCGQFVLLATTTDEYVLYDVGANYFIPLESEPGVSMACNEKVLALFNSLNNGIVREIDIYPLDRITPEARQRIEIEPSLLLGTVRGVPYLNSDRGIVSVYNPKSPILQLDPALGQPKRLRPVPGTEFSLLRLGENKSMLLDPTMSRYWVLNHRISYYLRQGFLSLEQGTLVVLSVGGTVTSCSLATGECEARVAGDLPITWIDID